MIVTDAMVNRFLTWPLPDSVCVDLCASQQGAPHRTGTNLLSFSEARQMLTHVLAEEEPQEAQRIKELLGEAVKFAETIVEQYEKNPSHLAYIPLDVQYAHAKRFLARPDVQAHR